MGKKSTRRAAVSAPAGATTRGQVPVVGPREPCPCGSGRRYKACHGRAAGEVAEAFVARPFEGLASECDLVAMKEIVPAATATLTLSAEQAGAVERPVTLATVLPMAWPGLVRTDGARFVGLQVPGSSGDASRDAGHALEQVLAAEPGSPIPPSLLPGAGPRLLDLLDPAAPLEVEVHEGFDFWLAGVEDRSPEVVASMERANEAVVPTVRLAGVEAAYWCQIRDRNHLRWVVPFDDEALLDALARLHATGDDTVGPGSRYVGSFRAHGLVVPVWDLDAGTPAEALEEPVIAFAGRLDEALADTTPLGDAARRAKSGLRSRQVTLR